MKIPAILIILMTYTVAKSQFDLEFQNYSGLTNFNSINSSSINSMIMSNNMSLNYSTENNFALYGGLGLNQYSTIPERNYYSSFLGSGFSSYIDDKESSSINLYLTGQLRKSFNIDDLSDSYQLLSGFQIINSISETSILNAKSAFKYKSFVLANQLNFVENITSLSFNQSFETKTSLRLTSGINTKLYNSNNSRITESSDVNMISHKSKINSSAFKFIYDVSLAQNLFENTGLKGSISGSYLLNDYFTPLDFIGFDFAGDNEFFDDPYSFESTSYKLSLVQLFASDIKLTSSITISNKNYNYDITSDETNYFPRKDIQSNYEINISKSFEFGESLIQNLIINLNYEYYNNNSNFDLMNFNGNYILLGVEIGL